MEDKIRILFCEDCKTLEELPDFEGPPEHDTLLALPLIALALRSNFGANEIGRASCRERV